MARVTPLNTLQRFLADKHAWEMFISGQAGTGKTTTLAELVTFLQEEEISYIVCAYTHKACEVLLSKLPENSEVATLHSFLKKCPGVNQHATNVKHLETSTSKGGLERYDVVIVDEYSMIGEKDYSDIALYQDQSEDGTPTSKFIYVGDPYQLPPVKDMQALEPNGDYCIHLDVVHRTDNTDLVKVASNLVDIIKGKPLAPLAASANFIREVDILAEYTKSTSDKILLAWTNKTVQAMNFEVAGKEFPTGQDALWNASQRHELVFLSQLAPMEVPWVSSFTGVTPLGAKFKPLEFLREQPEVQFFNVEDTTTSTIENIAVVFGTANHKQILQSIAEEAVAANKVICNNYVCESAAIWASINPTHPLTKRRAKAWRKYLTFKSLVQCVDFPYAMTIHKSQGSTYEEVYLDAKDLARCAEVDPIMYARLFYVAISRAANKVYTN